MSIPPLSPARQQLVAISVKLVRSFGKSICEPCGGRCCNRCADHRGYFRNDAAFQQAKRKYGFDASIGSGIGSKHYIKGLGFLGDQGCKIPREERSDTCLQFWCDDIVDKMNRRQEDLYNAGYEKRIDLV